MATYSLLPNVKRQYLDNSRNPLSGGKLYTVAAGGTYPADAVTTYQTSSGTAHTNPIILDSAGRISGSSELYVEPGQSYKLIAAASSSDYLTPLWTQDNIEGPAIDSDAVIIVGTAGENIAAGDVVYESDGLGSRVTGSWYRTDADQVYSSSEAPLIGVAPAAVASGTQGEFRIAGEVEVPGPLAPGSRYWVSPTAGGLTASPTYSFRSVGVAKTTTALIIAPDNAGKIPSLASVYFRDMTLLNTIAQARITLTTATPITVNDVTAATTVYYTPYNGNTVALYTGSLWVFYALTELSIAVPATTSTMYDLFLDYNDGTPVLAALAWTNDTTRATALTLQDNIYVKTGDTQQRYVGSFRTTGVSGQTEDSAANRFVYNAYNQVPRSLRVVDTTNSWDYDTATWRQARASALNQVTVVNGLLGMVVDLRLFGAATVNTNNAMGVGIGQNSTTAPTTGFTGGATAGGSQNILSYQANLTVYPAVGYSYFAWLEIGPNSGGPCIWYGDNGGTSLQTGMTGWLR